MDTLHVLRDGLPIPTSDTQFLKSRSGLARSLFNFYRLVRPLDFFDVSTHGFCKETARMAQFSSFRDFMPYLVAAHLAIPGCFAPFSPNIVAQWLPCE